MHRGYLKFWRMAEDSRAWSRGIEYRGLLITLLARANYKETSFLGEKIQPGQVAISMQRLADDLEISRDKLLRMLSNLKKDGVLEVENSHNRYTKITVLNFCKYQQLEEDNHTTDTLTDTTTAAQQPHTSKEGKKEYKKEAKASSSTAEADDSQAEVKSSGFPQCPHKEIIAVYHEVLPELPKVRGWNDSRAKQLNARWKESLQRLREVNTPCTKEAGIDWWRQFFHRVRAAPHYLHGFQRKDGTFWRPPGLVWFLTPEKFLKIIENGHLSPQRPT